MIPRKKLDIGWTDLAFGAWQCLRDDDAQARQAALTAWWSSEAHALAALSVRSGFDLVLRALALPPGSEVLVSAITIRDMVSIIEHHGLRAVPVDIDLETLEVCPDRLAQAIGPHTRAILVAHLFGSRMEMAPIAALARSRNLYLFEDCAQAYAADQYRGHADSDVAMFSYGPIKTATALGGAMLSFRDAGLCARVRTAQQQYPAQSRGVFLQRIVKYTALKFLSYRAPYSLFSGLCGLFGVNHDQVIGRALRGFAGGELMLKIRHRPSSALLALLERRLRHYRPAAIQQRTDAAATALNCMPGIARPGTHARHHSHWVFPVHSAYPDQLVSYLWRRGFDGTRGASNLCAVSATGGSQIDAPHAPNAHHMMQQIVYLPVYPGISQPDLRRMARAVMGFEKS